MERERKHIKKFYAVITDEVVAIFTDWEKARPLANGRKNLNKSFSRYYDALEYLKSNLSAKDLKEFGLDVKKPQFDRIITRKHH